MILGAIFSIATLSATSAYACSICAWGNGWVATCDSGGNLCALHFY